MPNMCSFCAFGCQLRSNVTAVDVNALYLKGLWTEQMTSMPFDYQLADGSVVGLSGPNRIGTIRHSSNDEVLWFALELRGQVLQVEYVVPLPGQDVSVLDEDRCRDRAIVRHEIDGP